MTSTYTSIQISRDKLKKSWYLKPFIDNVNPTVIVNPLVPVLVVLSHGIKARVIKLCIFFTPGAKLAFPWFRVVNMIMSRHAQKG
jgi:hypothetical protein